MERGREAMDGAGLSARESRAEEVFLSVLDLDESEREKRLRALCAGDEELRALVLSLLRHEREGRSILRRVDGQLAWSALADTAFRPGMRVGDFELLRELGRGGMGVVFEARQASIGRRVALKLLPPERLFDPRSVERFRREAEAAARVTHPALVAIHALGCEAGTHYIAQELVEGARTLAQHLEELRRAGSLDREHDRDVAQIFRELALALAAVHGAGVLHRDVKPSNVLLTPDGRPKLADFGLARLEGEQALSASGELLGTPSAMSPEQAAGRADLDARSDVFSLGVALYEALTLRRPFEGDSRAELLRRIERDDPIDPRRLRPRLAPELALIAMKALEKEPARRYASMAELAEDLRRFLAHEPIRARPPSPAQRALKWARRHPTRSVAATLGAISLAILGAVLAQGARRNAALATRGLELARLSALADLATMVAEADDLERMWPAHPDRIPAYRDWIRRAGLLVGQLPEHRAKLAELDRELEGPASVDRSAAEFWRSQLAKLIEGLERCEKLLLAEGARSPEHGWSVPERLRFAQELEREFAPGGAYAERWRRALPDILAAYPGLALEPQMGLVPIGPDPASKLWEFWHVASGAEPRRTADGTLEYIEDSGIVLVLLPGGTTWLGAQAEDPDQPNYDTAAQPDEGPVHSVTLRPFLISKYECTQAQWVRAHGANPSIYWSTTSARSPRPALHPVECVDWPQCNTACARWGLELPSEIQWEYAARAGTQTPWSTGADRDSLVGALNITDASQIRANFFNPLTHLWPEFDDGFVVHAPVDTLRPNDFGLLHVHGNVTEWCRETDMGGRPVRNHLPVDEHGDRTGGSIARSGFKLRRGGHYGADALTCRSAARFKAPVSFRSESLGLRPARKVTP